MAELETLRVSMEADVSNFKSNIKDATKTLEELEQELEIARKNLEYLTQAGRNGGDSPALKEFGDDLPRQINNVNSEIATLTKEIENLQNQSSQGGINNLKESLKGLEKLNIASELKKATKHLVKMGMAMVGIRSAYLGIRKSMSQYLSQNEELQNRLNACYYAIGSLFAPILEKIVNMVVKLVSYINVFVKALGFAGINMSNFGKNASSSAKTINKMLAGFDDLNNISSNDSGNGSASISNPFEDVQLDTSKVEIIQKVGEWCKENIPLIAGFITGLVIALTGLKALNIVKTIAEISPVASSMLKIFGGVSLVIAGLVMAITSFVHMWKNGWNIVGEIIKDIGIALAVVGAIILGVPSTIAIVVGVIVALVSTLAILIKEHWVEIKEWTLNTWESIKNGISKVWDGIKTGVTNGLNSIKSACSSILGTIKNTFANVWNGIWTIVKGIINKIISGVESMCNTTIRGLNALITPLTKVGNSILKAVGIKNFSFSSISTISLPRLAIGTNYVPQDMVAQIHKGEAVVPKKFNEEQFNNSQETNNLLKTLINVVDSKEFKTYISQSDIGKSAVNYINKQSRIMGGSLV